MAVTALVLADTHLRTGSPRWLPDDVLARARQVDVVLHAGDILDPGVLDRIATEAGVPVHAVLGNNDLSLVGILPTRKMIDLAGVRIGMVHDGGRSEGRATRLRRLFPDCQVVVFGHSHAPLAALGADGQLLFNPGSPTERRRQPRPTYGLLRLADGAVREQAIVAV